MRQLRRPRPGHRAPAAGLAAAVGIAVGLSGCGTGDDAPAVSPVSPGVASSSTTSTPAPLLAPEGGLFAPSPPASAATPAPPAPPAATVVMAVPPLPADLQHARPATPPTAPDDHDHGVGVPSASEVAAAWIAAVFTGRFDDPPGYADQFVAPLAANGDVAAAAVTSLPALSATAGEVRWPYIVTLVDDGDGWWRADVAVNTTRFGQVGPATSDVVVRVHVDADLLVDAWDVS